MIEFDQQEEIKTKQEEVEKPSRSKKSKKVKESKKSQKAKKVEKSDKVEKKSKKDRPKTKFKSKDSQKTKVSRKTKIKSSAKVSQKRKAEKDSGKSSTNRRSQDKKSNHMPMLIGGGVILALGIAAIVYFLTQEDPAPAPPAKEPAKAAVQKAQPTDNEPLDEGYYRTKEEAPAGADLYQNKKDKIYVDANAIHESVRTRITKNKLEYRKVK